MLMKLAVSLLVAMVTGLVGWGLGVSKTLAQQESIIVGLGDHINLIEQASREQRDDIKARLDRIQDDITEIRREQWRVRNGS